MSCTVQLIASCATSSKSKQLSFCVLFYDVPKSVLLSIEGTLISYILWTWHLYCQQCVLMLVHRSSYCTYGWCTYLYAQYAKFFTRKIWLSSSGKLSKKVFRAPLDNYSELCIIHNTCNAFWCPKFKGTSTIIRALVLLEQNPCIHPWSKNCLSNMKIYFQLIAEAHVLLPHLCSACQ